MPLQSTQLPTAKPPPPHLRLTLSQESQVQSPFKAAPPAVKPKAVPPLHTPAICSPAWAPKGTAPAVSSAPRIPQPCMASVPAAKMQELPMSAPGGPYSSAAAPSASAPPPQPAGAQTPPQLSAAVPKAKVPPPTFNAPAAVPKAKVPPPAFNAPGSEATPAFSAPTPTQVRTFFEPGDIGLAVNVDNGMVTSVKDGGQASRQGVNEGMLWLSVDGKPFSEELLRNVAADSKRYEGVFQTKPTRSEVHFFLADLKAPQGNNTLGLQWDLRTDGLKVKGIQTLDPQYLETVVGKWNSFVDDPRYQIQSGDVIVAVNHAVVDEERMNDELCHFTQSLVQELKCEHGTMSASSGVMRLAIRRLLPTALRSVGSE